MFRNVGNRIKGHLERVYTRHFIDTNSILGTFLFDRYEKKKVIRIILLTYTSTSEILSCFNNFLRP